MGGKSSSIGEAAPSTLLLPIGENSASAAAVTLLATPSSMPFIFQSGSFLWGNAGCQKCTVKTTQSPSAISSRASECSKESSKTMHFPSIHGRGSPPAIATPGSAPSGTLMPSMQVSRALVGPQCGFSFVPVPRTRKATSPPPQKARPVASAQRSVSSRTVSGNLLHTSWSILPALKSGTSFQLPSSTSIASPERMPTSLGKPPSEMNLSNSSLMLGKACSRAAHISMPAVSCQAWQGTRPLTMCAGRCHLSVQTPHAAPSRPTLRASSILPERSRLVERPAKEAAGGLSFGDSLIDFSRSARSTACRYSA
mmetsp:Transcript_103530/g.322557  ORF Transcript_103530/g.322557 Transcript_103530/m.322557 type:complete len:311 (-) Transcript_103530:739-1671(-)